MAEVALVTGASGGIGEDLARLIAQSGRDLVLLARNAARLQSLADELSQAHKITATVLAMDLSAEGAADSAARALAERQITIDLLINNAGYGSHGPFARAHPPEQQRMLQLNVVALTMLTQFLLPGMIERRRGRILNVASTAAFQPGPLMAVYYASKAYVVSLSLALTEETAGTGVSVTCLCPGATRTGFQARAGMGKARLMTAVPIMTSADVARAGFDGMMAGKPLVIPGIANKISAQGTRLLPRRVAAKLAGALNAEH
jgi:short-subunit dehydrogenase